MNLLEKTVGDMQGPGIVIRMVGPPLLLVPNVLRPEELQAGVPVHLSFPRLILISCAGGTEHGQLFPGALRHYGHRTGGHRTVAGPRGGAENSWRQLSQPRRRGGGPGSLRLHELADRCGGRRRRFGDSSSNFFGLTRVRLPPFPLDSRGLERGDVLAAAGVWLTHILGDSLAGLVIVFIILKLLTRWLVQDTIFSPFLCGSLWNAHRAA
jgi:hypothetical protein